MVRPETSAATGGVTTGRGRSAALDGLRGLALAAVLGYHVAPGIVPGGFLGVEVFFVLSGYLLASVLRDEYRRTGSISRSRYAIRRLRRVGPALATLLASLLVLVPWLAPDGAHRLAGDVVASVAGVTNWHLVAGGSSYFEGVGRPSLVRHLWSVAIEVQFYVLCPFLVAWLASWHRRRLAVATLAGGVGMSALLLALLYRSGDPSRAYFGTDTRIGALLSGVLLAAVLDHHRDGAGSASPGFVVRRLGPVALGVLALALLAADDRARLSYPLAFLVAQAVTAVLIAAARHRGPVASVLAAEPLRWLGVRSFGIYLWHWPVLVLLRPGVDVGWSPAVSGIVSILMALVLGTLSYGLIERRRVRPRLPAPRRERQIVPSSAVAGLAGVALVVGLLTRLPTADPLEETLRAGEAILASRPEPPPAAPIVTPVEAAPLPPPPPPVPESVPAVPTEPAPVEPPPPGPRSIAAIGDSVMISAAGALQTRLGPAASIDARNSRQFAEGIVLVRRMREEQRLPAVMVVHLGNNGPVRPSDVDALMTELTGVSRVLLVNVRVPKPWGDLVNQTLADAAARYPSVSLVDWNGSSDGHRAWFQRDGTHFRATSGPGASAYADLIVAAIPPPAPAPAAAPELMPAPLPPAPASPAATGEPATTAPLPTGAAP